MTLCLGQAASHRHRREPHGERVPGQSLWLCRAGLARPRAHRPALLPADRGGGYGDSVIMIS